MKIAPELLTGLGYTRHELGIWSHDDLDFAYFITEYDEIDGVRFYLFNNRAISEADELLNSIFAAGVEEGRKQSADDFRRLIGLKGED
jgi:hypothetical protein